MPVEIHGTAFTPNTINTGTVTLYGANGMVMDAASTSHAALASATLIVGTTVSQILVRIVDNVGTQLMAHFGDANLTVTFDSGLSNGSGTEQTLTITPTPGFQTVPGNSYWISVDRISGTGAWQIIDAAIQ